MAKKEVIIKITLSDLNTVVLGPQAHRSEKGMKLRETKEWRKLVTQSTGGTQSSGNGK